MSVSFIFGAEDPARVRFALSPLLEIMSAVRVLFEPQRRQYHLPWLEAVRPDIGRMDLWPLMVLSPRFGWTPDFISPGQVGPGTDIGDQLAQVRRTPPGQVVHELRRSLTERSDSPAPEAAWRLLDDPVATLTLLSDLLQECWRLLIEPHWPRLRELLEADVSYRAQVLADYGLERVLGDLHPRARWTGNALMLEAPGTVRRRLGGAGLLLIPSVFIWPSLAAVVDPPAKPALLYPARGIAELWQPSRTRHSDALARLIGRTRAALLESLAEPASTQTLAGRHGLAPSTVSGHLAALHEAGLVTRRRLRHAVLYRQTSLGTELVNGG